MKNILKSTAASILAAAIMLSAGAASAYADTLKTENGLKYICADSGKTSLYTGWTKKGGSRYYYKDGVMKKNCWLKVGGERKYYLKKDGTAAVGKITLSGTDYEFDKNGALIKSNIALIVNGQNVVSDNAPYYAGGTLMIPLADTAKALGYISDFDEQSGKVFVSDDYIQSADINVGSDEAAFTGLLQYIDLSRDVAMSHKAELKNGCVFVPADFFEEFLNDVVITDSSVEISPSMAYID